MFKKVHSFKIVFLLFKVNVKADLDLNLICVHIILFLVNISHLT